VQSEYARLAGIFFRLAGVARPATRERLLQRLETDLRSED